MALILFSMGFTGHADSLSCVWIQFQVFPSVFVYHKLLCSKLPGQMSRGRPKKFVDAEMPGNGCHSEED